MLTLILTKGVLLSNIWSPICLYIDIQQCVSLWEIVLYVVISTVYTSRLLTIDVCYINTDAQTCAQYV